MPSSGRSSEEVRCSASSYTNHAKALKEGHLDRALGFRVKGTPKP